MFDFKNWNWDKIDNFVASMARPWQQYVCSSSIAGSLAWAVINKADATVIAALAVPCAGLAGGSAYLRSVDKKTAADVAKTVGAASAP